MNSKLAVLTALLAGATACAPARAAPGDALAECVTLSPDHQASRFGTQYLLVKDDSTHYRLGFGGGACDAMAMSARVEIHTDGTPNRLCPSGSEVATKRDTCKVSGVQEITPEQFERYSRRGRR